MPVVMKRERERGRRRERIGGVDNIWRWCEFIAIKSVQKKKILSHQQ